MNRNVIIGIALAIFGAVLGIIGLIWIFSISGNLFATLMPTNPLRFWVAIIGGLLFVIGVIIAGSAWGPEVAAKPVKPVKEVAAKPVKKEVAAKPVKEAKIELPSFKSIPVIKVEGIGPKYAEKLNAAGIKTTKDLLIAGRKPAGREDIAKKTGISPKLILEWVRDADFVRVKGVSEEYSDLLDEAEVRDVIELAKQDPKVLHPKLLAASEKKKIVRRPPSLSEVTKWVNQAKKLPKVIEY